MAKKVTIIGGILASVVVVMLLLTAFMPAITPMIQVAYDDPSAGNYIGYKEAVGAAPIWLYAIPLLVGAVAVIVTLKATEPKGR